MYVKKVQITNYGPIEALDIVFPFDGDNPNPIVLVGANGSGKSIFLSHIVNALLSAQQRAYPGSPEVTADRVYKLRSPDYVRSGTEFSFTRVEFVDAPPAQELVLRTKPRNYQNLPEGISGTEAQESYNILKSSDTSIFHQVLDEQAARDLFEQNCVLYFPPNRFEEPAWLNEEHLISKVSLIRFGGHLPRGGYDGQNGIKQGGTTVLSSCGRRPFLMPSMAGSRLARAQYLGGRSTSFSST